MPRRSPLVLLTALSAGLFASCTENAPPSSSASTGTRKVIPSNVALNAASDVGPAVHPTGQPGAGGVVTPSGIRSGDDFGAVAPVQPGARAARRGPSVPPVQTPAVQTSDLPDAPADAQWTLYCQSIQGAGHARRATEVKEQLVRSTGMKQWYVIHAGEASNLYYGFYRSIDSSERSASRRDGQQAQRDRRRIDEMKDAGGERPFSRCMFVELAAPDPEAPSDWNLANAPQDMYWSVQIAAYQHHPDRKRYAVEAVRDARRRGVPAYFFHGQTVSSVCVGAWPIEAVRYDVPRGMAGDPTKTILLMPEGLPPLRSDLKDTDRRPMEVAKKEVEIVDPSLIATLRQYPTHAINGAVRQIKGKNRRQEAFTRPEPSFMVRVPNRYVQGEKTGDAVNPDNASTSDSGFSFLRPQHQRRQESKHDYIPKR